MKRTIKGLRCDLGLTQKEMAKELGISEGTYVRYENYQTKVPFDVAIKICDLGKIENPREVRFS